MKKSILGIICAILAIAFTNSCSNSTKANVDENDTIAIVNDTVAVDSIDSLDSEVKNGWNYESEIDEMDGSTTKRAIAVSSNIVEFDFPYNGGSTLGICVRKTRKYGTDVMISISKGQFVCSEYNGTNYVTVRFNNNAPIKFTTVEPSDYSNDLLFLQNPKKFIKLAKNAKTIKIEAPFFNEGLNVFTFKTKKPLVW